VNILTFLILGAAVATVFSLVAGITSMARDGEVGHRTSAQWMTSRVVFQAAALVLILLALAISR
jgi:hypothetical protein